MYTRNLKMEFNAEKVKSYIGFAIKSRQIKFGVDDILKLKHASLIVVSSSLAESGMKKLTGYSTKKQVKMIVLNPDCFGEIIQNVSVKAAAVTDDNLADAIKKNLANN